MITPYPTTCPNIPFDLGPEWWTTQTHEAQFSRLVGPSTKNIIEIGSFVGRSTLAWLRMAPSATVWCIDPWEGELEVVDGMRYKDHHSKPIWDSFVRNTWDVRERVRMVRGLSQFAIPYLAGELRCDEWIDLIYIDGDHGKEAVKQDIRLTYKHLVRPSFDFDKCTHICGDDFYWSSVKEALEEMTRDGEVRFVAVGNVWVMEDVATLRYKGNV